MTLHSSQAATAARPCFLLRSRVLSTCLLAFLLSACGGGAAGSGSAEAPQGATASTTLRASVLDGRLIAGYQAWYGCPGDYDGNTLWIHWFDTVAEAGRITVDMLPDVSTLPSLEQLCTTDGSGLYAELIALCDRLAMSMTAAANEISARYFSHANTLAAQVSS